MNQTKPIEVRKIPLVLQTYLWPKKGYSPEELVSIFNNNLAFHWIIRTSVFNLRLNILYRDLSKEGLKNRRHFIYKHCNEKEFLNFKERVSNAINDNERNFIDFSYEKKHYYIIGENFTYKP